MTFDDIQNKDLQAYNRAVMFFNIMEDMSKDAAAEYVKDFSQEDKIRMALVIERVKKHGPDYVKAEISRALELPPEEEQMYA
jgi:hypothetical protein